MTTELGMTIDEWICEIDYDTQMNPFIHNRLVLILAQLNVGICILYPMMDGCYIWEI